jgi:hypothetical protein
VKIGSSGSTKNELRHRYNELSGDKDPTSTIAARSAGNWVVDLDDDNMRRLFTAAEWEEVTAGLPKLGSPSSSHFTKHYWQTVKPRGSARLTNPWSGKKSTKIWTGWFQRLIYSVGMFSPFLWGAIGSQRPVFLERQGVLAGCPVVPTQDRMAVLLNPASYEAYYDRYGVSGITNLFVGINEVHVREWANWFGETLTHKEERKEEALTALKETLDRLRDKHPTGPFSDISSEHWYGEQLAPAAERKRKHWSNKDLRKRQVGELWGEGWQKVFDPGKALPYSNSH